MDEAVTKFVSVWVSFMPSSWPQEGTYNSRTSTAIILSMRQRVQEDEEEVVVMMVKVVLEVPL